MKQSFVGTLCTQCVGRFLEHALRFASDCTVQYINLAYDNWYSLSPVYAVLWQCSSIVDRLKKGSHEHSLGVFSIVFTNFVLVCDGNGTEDHEVLVGPS